VTLLANSEGRPWTESGFRASWRPCRLKLEAARLIGPGFTLYGLRHTVATVLREIGFDPRTIADALGQKTTAMAEHYSRRADLKPKMVGVVRDFGAEVNRRRTKTVEPEG
jgi:integrase